MKQASISLAVVSLAVAALVFAAGHAVAASPAPAGIAACSGCHPAQAGVASALPPLAGRKPAEIVDAMRAFRTGQRSATVMDRIAKGFSDTEVEAIANWYSSQ
ncbi:MAG TPA: cytochrome C [Xanthobacteraceae bacterium]|jgi:cytochrome c553|nr:cytochrome C [Xanthobacteraceae bacterium]